MKKANLSVPAKDVHNSPENSEDTENELLTNDNENLGNVENNEYKKKLQSYREEICAINDKTKQVTRIYCINEQVLEKEFYKYIDEMLVELGVDCNSFYR